MPKLAVLKRLETILRKRCKIMHELIDKRVSYRYNKGVVLHKNCRMEVLWNAITVQNKKL